MEHKCTMFKNACNLHQMIGTRFLPALVKISNLEIASTLGDGVCILFKIILLFYIILGIL